MFRYINAGGSQPIEDPQGHCGYHCMVKGHLNEKHISPPTIVYIIMSRLNALAMSDPPLARTQGESMPQCVEHHSSDSSDSRMMSNHQIIHSFRIHFPIGTRYAGKLPMPSHTITRTQAYPTACEIIGSNEAMLFPPYIGFNLHGRADTHITPYQTQDR